MQFKIKTEEFKNILANATTICSSKTNFLITECVKIQAENGKIKLTATDLETGYLKECDTEVSSEGTICINAKKLFEIVRTFPSGEFELTANDRMAEIKKDKLEYKIICMPVDDFPEISFEIHDIKFIKVDAHKFKSMINYNLSIPSLLGDSRPHINGMAMIQYHDTLRLASTDTKRITKSDLQFDEMFIDNPLIIPKKGMNALAKFIDGKTLQIGKTNYDFIVKKETETIAIHMLEGDYPEVDNFFNVDEHTKITINKTQFLKMLKRMDILTSDQSKAIMFEFYDNKLCLSIQNAELGQGLEEINIEYSGDPMQAAFNPKFIMDAINVTETAEIELWINSPKTPLFITGTDNLDSMSVVMPMRV